LPSTGDKHRREGVETSMVRRGILINCGFWRRNHKTTVLQMVKPASPTPHA
jgi:hypothetical protein